jgi:hypothetical protein
MHSVTINRLQSFAEEAERSGNPRRYLELFGPLHNTWHSFPSVGRRVGFLLFHWHVMEHFRALGLHDQMGVTPYTVTDFSPGGQFAEADWNETMQGVAASRSLDDLVDYSGAIESWHNEAHMVIADATGTPLMDPSINIFYSVFWNLHSFINRRFEAELQNYMNAAHPTPGFQTPKIAVEHIEDQHHRYVRRI